MIKLTDIQVLIAARHFGNTSTKALRENVNKHHGIDQHIATDAVDGLVMHRMFKDELTKRGINYDTGMQEVTTTVKIKCML